jgi:hypothetical protein
VIADLQDGKRALGVGLAFFAYAAFLFWDAWYKRQKQQRMQIARDNRETLIEQEMTVD